MADTLTVTQQSARLGDVLTWRERRVLGLIAQGYTNEEIGAMLLVAPSTVAQDVKRLRKKLGARNRAHAVGNWFRAARQGAAAGNTHRAPVPHSSS